MEYLIRQRLVFLAIAALYAWVFPRFIAWPPRQRSLLSWREYSCAYRASRWFLWEPAPATQWLLRVAIMGLGVYIAFPEVFLR